MEVMHYSQEWDNAGMPHAIFFTKRGHSIHGSDHPGLGTAVSHGCVRLSLPNATALYQLVQANGMAQTKVVVRDPAPPGITVPSQPPRQRGLALAATSIFSLLVAHSFCAQICNGLLLAPQGPMSACGNAVVASATVHN